MSEQHDRLNSFIRLRFYFIQIISESDGFCRIFTKITVIFVSACFVLKFSFSTLDSRLILPDIGARIRQDKWLVSHCRIFTKITVIFVSACFVLKFSFSTLDSRLILPDIGARIRQDKWLVSHCPSSVGIR